MLKFHDISTKMLKNTTVRGDAPNSSGGNDVCERSARRTRGII